VAAAVREHRLLCRLLSELFSVGGVWLAAPAASNNSASSASGGVMA